MTLEYLWTESFKNIEKSGFLLSNNFDISVTLNENKIFNVDINKNNSAIPEDFFGKKISRINIISGKNGAGKTSLLNLIHGQFPRNSNYLYIYFDKKLETLYYKSSKPVSVTNSTSINFDDINNYYYKKNNYKTDSKAYLAIRSKQKTKYIKCNFDYAPLFSNENSLDNLGDFAEVIHFDHEIKLLKNNNFSTTLSVMITQVLYLIHHYPSILSLYNFSIPKTLTLKIIHDTKPLDDFYTTLNLNPSKFDPFLRKVFMDCYHEHKKMTIEIEMI